MIASDIIVNALRTGEDNAIKANDLAKLADLKPRELRSTLDFLRGKGVVICSSQNGYFYPETKRELGRYIHQETARERSITQNLRFAQAMYNKWDGDGD